MFRVTYIGPDFKTLVYRLILSGLIILSAFNFGSLFYVYAVVNLPQKADVKTFALVLENSSAKSLELKVQDKTVVLKSEDIKEMLERYKRAYSDQEDMRVSSEKLYEYLKTLALNVNVEPVNANMRFEGNRATVFRPAVEGVRLDIYKSAKAILTALINNQNQTELIVEKVSPTVTLEKINDLGIETLLAKGESNFAGSSVARIYNIRLGASKLNGVIIEPGEKFSFNDALGNVDERSGFESELVIKNGELIPEFGGGLCQVSTTMFRAVIFAGLPIIERRPHSFPVKYYNPQGFDATIYPGVVDLKFLNDTPAYLLVQTKILGTKLIFEIYGSDNGRRVALDGPYQYDQKANGAMKAYFVRKMTSADGTEKEERFDSNYKPPIPLARNPLE